MYIIKTDGKIRRIYRVEIIELQNYNGAMHANKPTINRVFTYLLIVH